MCEIETLQNQLDSLVAVLARYADWVLRMDDLSKLHYFYHEEEVSLDYEMLRDIRKNQGISQGEVQSCTQGSLSRIENGKQAPSKRHVMEIAEELGVNKSYYISRVQSEDYDLYELCHWVNQAGFHQEWDKENQMLDRLEKVLDMSIPVNLQYVNACRIGVKKAKKEIDPISALREMEKILRYTMPDYQEDKLRVPSREEFVILNVMAGLMRTTEQFEKGLKLRKYILQTYKESRVSEEYHTNSIVMLYMCYGEMLEADNQLDLAELMDIDGFRMDIWCGKGEMIGKILANLAYVYNKKDPLGESVFSKESLWCAYQFCILMKQEKLVNVVKECYHTLFMEKINDYCHHPHQTAQTDLDSSACPSPRKFPPAEHPEQ